MTPRIGRILAAGLCALAVCGAKPAPVGSASGSVAPDAAGAPASGPARSSRPTVLPPGRAGRRIAALSRHDWTHDHHLEMRTLWLDATANLETLSTRDGVRRILDRAVEAGFNTIGVGVKTPGGRVLYDSRIAPRMDRFLGRFTYPAKYDLLHTVVEEGHRRGLKVHALVMVFSDGRKLDRSGPAYSAHAVWQAVDYLPGGARVREADNRGGTFVFLNPLLPDVQSYEIAVLKEIVARYDVDGVAIDRCRYSGISADFSDASRRAFERFLGHPVARFPQQVLTWSRTGPIPGRYFRPWLEFRAAVIGGFVRRAAAAVHRIRPGVQFGSVVGAWYPTYLNEGVNWGSPRFNPGKEWPWATATYRRTGYADSIDYLVPNCYSPRVEIQDAEAVGFPGWRSVEGGAQMARLAVANACWVYGGVFAEDFRGKPDEFVRAIQTVRRETSGVMAFDVSQIEEYGWWPVVLRAFRATLSDRR